MKVVKKTETNRHQNCDHCAAIEYPLGDKDINLAVIELTGRYPERGMVVNDVCKEIAYVEKGSCTIGFDDQVVELEKGDTIMIEPGRAYYWEGEATLVVPCTPAWYPEQHREIE